MRVHPSMYSRMMQSSPSTRRSRRCGRCSRGRGGRSGGPPRTKSCTWPGSPACFSCLMTRGRWKPACPTSRPFHTRPMPPAPSSWRTRYFGLSAVMPRLRWRQVYFLDRETPRARRGRRAHRGGAVRRDGDPGPRPAHPTCGWAPGRTCAPWPSSCATTRWGRSWWACPCGSTAPLGPQAEKVLAFVEALQAALRVPVADLGRAPHHGRGRAHPAREGGEGPGAQGLGRPHGRGPDPAGLPRRARAQPRPRPDAACGCASC